MDGSTQRKWDIIFKWFGLCAVLASAWWTVYKYRDDRQIESIERVKQEAKDEEARTKDQNSFIFQRQGTLYFDAARAAATIATALDPKSVDRMAISSNALKDARERFAQLYWGELVVVEDRRVEIAMIIFQQCLLRNGVNCVREYNNQFQKPIAREKLTVMGQPTLQELSLEIGACVRTALQDDRKIQFGQMQPAITVCPYD